MNNTLIYTNDEKNSKAYSLSDKLYLAHGDYSATQYLMVGANSPDNLNSGLRIDKAYWGAKNDPVFWLRATPPNRISAHITALEVWPTARIINNKVSNGDKRGVKPAFELKLSEVLFGSTIPAVSADGTISNDEAFTLRYRTDHLGSAQISSDKKSVQLTNVPTDTYLVVQNSEGAYAKQINGESSITADRMGIDSFDHCKVWLEKTDDRITYATYAVDFTGYDVTVQVGLNMTVRTGNEVQTNVTGAISEIKVSADEGYYFSKDYISSISSNLHGLKIKQLDNHTIIISGTPNDDVLLVLPDALFYQNPNTGDSVMSYIILTVLGVVAFGISFKKLMCE